MDFENCILASSIGLLCNIQVTAKDSMGLFVFYRDNIDSSEIIHFRPLFLKRNCEDVEELLGEPPARTAPGNLDVDQQDETVRLIVLISAPISYVAHMNVTN